MTTIPAPYLRIAAALKQRIVDGELRRGDRLPSARQLVREWGVALATATKALAVLRHQRLIEGAGAKWHNCGREAEAITGLSDDAWVDTQSASLSRLWAQDGIRHLPQWSRVLGKVTSYASMTFSSLD